MDNAQSTTKILRASEAKGHIESISSNVEACYVLWDHKAQIPVYVGTARNKGRLKAHLKKDYVRDGRIGLTYRNPEFLNFIQQKPEGWLGISISTFSSHDEAKNTERSLVRKYGLRTSGGTLSNRRLAG